MTVENRLIDLMADKMKRERRAITPAEVAKACKMSRQNVNRWLTNQVKCYPAATLDVFCDFFDCSIGDLFIRTPSNNQESR